MKKFHRRYTYAARPDATKFGTSCGTCHAATNGTSYCTDTLACADRAERDRIARETFKHQAGW